MRENIKKRHIDVARSIAIVLLLGVSGSAAVAQQGGPPETIRALPSATNPPPDAVELDQRARENIPNPPGKGQSKGRVLPAAASPPPDVMELERRAKDKIPDPPAKGQGKGHVLPAAATPPPDSAEAAQAAKQEMPSPPGKAGSEALLDKIGARPGGAERVEAAKQGKAPLKSQGRSAESTSSVLKIMGNFLMEQAEAGETFTLDLTPQVSGSLGQHRGLYSSSPYGYATAYGAVASPSYPSNSMIYLRAFTFSQLAHQVSNPFISSAVDIPADGWYIIDINAYASGSDVNIHHYEGSSFVLLENMPGQSGWADYPTLQYLTSGRHYFYFVFTGSAYVSRISYDSYP